MRAAQRMSMLFAVCAGLRLSRVSHGIHRSCTSNDRLVIAAAVQVSPKNCRILFERLRENKTSLNKNTKKRKIIALLPAMQTDHQFQAVAIWRLSGTQQKMVSRMQQQTINKNRISKGWIRRRNLILFLNNLS